MLLERTEPHEPFQLVPRLLLVLRPAVLQLLLILEIKQLMLDKEIVHLVPLAQPAIILLYHPELNLLLFGQIIIPELQIRQIFLSSLVKIHLELSPETVVPGDLLFDGRGGGEVRGKRVGEGLVGEVVDLLERVVGGRVLAVVGGRGEAGH